MKFLILKFLIRLEKIPTETFKLLQEVDLDTTMSRTQHFELHKKFKDAREDVEDDSRSGRPTASRTNENVENVREKVCSDHRLTVRMIPNELSMNSERLWRVITEDLKMRKICTKMASRLLNDRQKEHRVQVCQDILKRLETEPDLLSRIVAGEESWIIEYDSLTKQQSPEWKSALSTRPKKVRLFKSKIKVMLIVFFDVHGIIYLEFLPQGQTSNQNICKNILRRLMYSIQEKRRELLETKSWLLHLDNTPAHNALSIRQFFAENNSKVMG